MTTPTMQHLAPEARRRSEGLTLPRVLHRNAEEHGDLPAITSNGNTITWRQLRDDATAFARAFHAHGLRRGDRMMIMMSSRLEHWQADLGASLLGAVTCTLYRTSSPEQVAYMARHGKAIVAVLEDASDVARWLPNLDSLPDLKRLVVLDASAVPSGDARFMSLDAFVAEGRASSVVLNWQDIEPGDPVTMMYTSGTTGNPKGAVLTHANVFYSAAMLDLTATLPPHASIVAYLPLAHISERQRSIYRVAFSAHSVHVIDAADVAGGLRRVRPPGFFGVPRVWEKFAATLRQIVTALPPEERATAEAAHATALEAYRLAARGEPVSAELATKAAAAETQLRPIRGQLGLDTVQFASSGAAPIPVDILELLGGFGIRILEVWGMTETTGAITISTPDYFRPGKVGRVAPGIEVKVAPDGELLARGPMILRGYLAADGSITKATDDDGWFATGDVGEIDADGFVKITDRKKELLITATGKNVAPSPIEGLLRAHPLIAQAMIIGDRRPYITALFALDPDVVRERALSPEAMRAELEAHVAGVNARLSRPEQVKKFHIVPDTWVPGTTLLTPTLKMRRRQILEHYAADVDRLYAQD